MPKAHTLLLVLLYLVTPSASGWILHAESLENGDFHSNAETPFLLLEDSRFGPLIEPNGLDGSNGFGPLIEPNGLDGSNGFGPLIEPNGLDGSNGFGPLIEPNGLDGSNGFGPLIEPNGWL